MANEPLPIAFNVQHRQITAAAFSKLDRAVVSRLHEPIRRQGDFPRHDGSVSPAPRIAKGGSSEFRCFFLNLFIFRSKKKSVEIPSVRARLLLVFEARLLQFPASAGRSLFYMSRSSG